MRSPIPLHIHKTDLEFESGLFTKHVDLIAKCIQGKVVVWGRPNLSIVRIYDVSEKSWRNVQVKGDVHDGDLSVASVSEEGIIYLYGGGYAGSERLTSLTLDGNFRRVTIKGKQPFPRFGSVGWSHKGKLFFAFGSMFAYDFTEDRYIKGGDWSGIEGLRTTNEIIKFNLEEESVSFLDTEGSRPKPRSDCGCAQRGSKVYVHGGHDLETGVINDFHSLDMETYQWTVIFHTGISVTYHSLTVAGPKQLMLLGGAKALSVKNSSNMNYSVMLFNTETSHWKIDQQLPQEFCGQAVAVKQGSKVAKIIGVGRYGAEVLSSHLFEFYLKS